MTTIAEKFKPRREDVVNLVVSTQEKKLRAEVKRLRKEVESVEVNSVQAEAALKKGIREHALKKLKGKITAAEKALAALGFEEVVITVQTMLTGVLSQELTHGKGQHSYKKLHLTETPVVVSVYIEAARKNLKREAQGNDPWERSTTLKNQIELDLKGMPKKIATMVEQYRHAASRLDKAREELRDAQSVLDQKVTRRDAVKAAMTVEALRDSDEGKELLESLVSANMVDRSVLLLSDSA